jgi:hypothetical protein
MMELQWPRRSFWSFKSERGLMNTSPNLSAKRMDGVAIICGGLVVRSIVTELNNTLVTFFPVFLAMNERKEEKTIKPNQNKETRGKREMESVWNA